jgi:hypothetical protein
VGAAADLADLISELAAATGRGTFTPPGWTGDIYRVDLRRLVAN